MSRAMPSARATGLRPQPAARSSRSSVPIADEAPRPSAAPCGTCPYRCDVPAGIWEAREYAKLPPYDGETWQQPPALFFCHQNDGHLCAGWVGCHDTDHLLSLRFHRVHPETFDYVSPVPLFASGAEAAAHGLSGVDEPGRDARHAIEKLARKRAAQGGVTEGRDGEAGSVSEANSTRSDEVGCAPTAPDPTPSKLGG